MGATLKGFKPQLSCLRFILSPGTVFKKTSNPLSLSNHGLDFIPQSQLFPQKKTQNH